MNTHRIALIRALGRAKNRRDWKAYDLIAKALRN
jgi:hypothetical protein